MIKCFSADTWPGLPDGMFSNIQIWVIFRGFCNGLCWYIFGNLVYFMDRWYILWPFGIFYGYLVCFPRFGMMYQGKSFT
jgi:hypothetical protein